MDLSCTKEYWVDNKPTKYTKFAQSRRGVGAERREPPGEFIERFFRSIKTECLRKMIFFGEGSLRRSQARSTVSMK